MSNFFFCSLRSQNILKKAEICRKYVNYLKYVIFLNNGKISKNIFFTYLHILFESRLRSVEDCDWNVGKCEVGVWKCKGCGGVRCGMFVRAKCGEVKGVVGCVFVSGQLILLAAKLLNNLSIIQEFKTQCNEQYFDDFFV